MRETQKSRDIVRAKREIMEYTLFQKLLNLPNFTSLESHSNAGLIGLFEKTQRTSASQKDLQIDDIYEKFGCLHANTRFVSGGKHSPHFAGPIARLESQMCRLIEDELFDHGVDQISTPSLVSSFISEVLYGHQNNVVHFNKGATNLPLGSYDSLASLYSAFIAARMRYPSNIFFNIGEEFSKKTGRYSKMMSLVSFAQEGQQTDEQFKKQIEIHKTILDKLNLSYRILELNPKQMDPTAYRSVSIEIKPSGHDKWIPYTTINHKSDYVTSKLSIYYEEDVPVRV